MNSAKFRRKQNTMIVCGWGVLILGIWSVLRFILSVSMEFQRFLEVTVLPYIDPVVENEGVIIGLLTIALVVFFSLIDVLIRFVICRGANAEGRGTPKNGFYAVLLCFYMLANLITVFTNAYAFNVLSENTVEEVFASLLMSVTDFVITVDLFAATVSVRRTMRREGMYKKSKG